MKMHRVNFVAIDMHVGSNAMVLVLMLKKSPSKKFLVPALKKITH